MWTQLVAISKLGEADRDQASRCSELVALLDALRRRAERLAACRTNVILVAALKAAAGWSSGAMVARNTSAASGELAISEFRRQQLG